MMAPMSILPHTMLLSKDATPQRSALSSAGPDRSHGGAGLQLGRGDKKFGRGE